MGRPFGLVRLCASAAPFHPGVLRSYMWGVESRALPSGSPVWILCTDLYTRVSRHAAFVCSRWRYQSRVCRTASRWGVAISPKACTNLLLSTTKGSLNSYSISSHFSHQGIDQAQHPHQEIGDRPHPGRQIAPPRRRT